MTRAIAPAVTALVVAAQGVAAFLAADRIRELAWLRDLPRADAATATAMPARYTGKLHGPPGRVTPAGDRAAAFWWVVVYRDSEGASTVYCSARERSRLALETASGSMRLAFTEADPAEVGLTSDEEDDEIDRPLAIDLGTTQKTAAAAVPAGTCDGEHAVYEQLFIPEGADVEVVGCAKDGAIDRCGTPLAGVLSMPDLTENRRHRAAHALTTFRLALGFSALLLVAAGVILAVKLAEILRVLRPRREG